MLTVFISCSKEDASTETVSSEKAVITVNDFSSEEMMENKINEIVLLKEQKEKVVLENFAKKNNSSNKLNSSEQLNNQKNEILKDLKAYHKEKLNSIYELRKEINFTSIQSVADEINSLLLLNPIMAKEIFNKYKTLLVKNRIEVQTVFDSRIANVINLDGEVYLNGEKLMLDKFISTNITGKYLGDEEVISDVAASSGNYFVYYLAGREAHKNSLGVRFFKYFTELKSYMLTPNGLVACPSTFVVDSSSRAGYVQTRSQFFSDYSFTYPYISGTGTSVRYVGGNKNTPYYPAGGSILGKFSTTLGGEYFELNCNIKYLHDK